MRVVFLKNFRGYRKAEAVDVPAETAATWSAAGLVRVDDQAALFDRVRVAEAVPKSGVRRRAER